MGHSFISSGFAIAISMPCSGRNLLLVHDTGMELDLYCLPFDASFCGQDPGVLKLDTVAEVTAKLSNK
jgi:hypothetical protein